VFYMALELNNKSWRLALSDGAKRWQVSIAAGDLAKLTGQGALRAGARGASAQLLRSGPSEPRR
jgi:hypothetical protein